MAFELNPTTSSLPLGAGGELQEQAGALSGIGRAVVTAPPRAALEAARGAHILATGSEPGLTTEQRDAQFRRIDETYKPYIDALSPHSYDTGRAGEILGGFLEAMSGLLTGGVRGAIVAPSLKESIGLVGQGVDSDTATQAFVGLSAANALGFKIPFIGRNLLERVSAGIGSNVAIGAGTDALMTMTLNEGGYGELAKQYDPFNTNARLIDALIGGAFGGLAHHLEGSGPRLDPGVADAVLELNRSRQAMHDSLPGRPGDVGALQAHVVAAETATRQAARGEPVDVASTVLGHDFKADPILDEQRVVIKKAVDKAVAETVSEMEGKASAKSKDQVSESALKTGKQGGIAEPDGRLAQRSDSAAIQADKTLGREDRANRIVELSPEHQGQAVGDEVARQFREAGGSPAEAQANGALWAAVAETMGRRYGILPGSILIDSKLRIERMAQQVAGLESAKPGILSQVAEAVGLKRGQIRFGESTVIGLLNSDASTLPHESAHFWLETIRELSDSGNARAEQDYQHIRQLLGNEGGALTDAQHEQFAKSFEQYLATGEAPTAGLKAVFDQFKDWLLRVYRSLTDMGAKLSPEVKQTFDVLLGKHEEMRAKEAAPETPESKQAHAIAESTPERLVAFDENSILTAHDALRMADEDIAKAEEAAHYLDEVVRDITTENLNVPDRVLNQSSKQTDTPEFRRWFGESKVVDAEGRPLVVYHGTNKEFDVFATAAGPRSKMVGDWDGVHFTNDRAQAQSIADSLARREGGTPRVVEAYLRAENPAPFGKYLKQEQAVAAGYDSRLTQNNVGLQEWTVFKPTQIKSAIGNRGTFDPNSPRILDQGMPKPEGVALTPDQRERMRGEYRQKLRYLQDVKRRGSDEAINKMSQGELQREASRQTAQDMVNEAQEKKRRVHLAVIAAEDLAKIQDNHPDGPMRGLVTVMVRDKADKSGVQSFESRESAKRSWALARLMPALEATNPKLFGLVEDRQGWRDLVREIYGEDTANKKAKEGAKAWLGVVEDMRSQGNYAGFNIAKLMSYRLPQSHGRKAVAAAGVEKWVAFVLPKLDRERYVDEKGKLLDDREMEAFLAQAHENIVTNGMNSLEPGAYKGGTLVNKYQEHRAIHFAKADDYINYLNKYGDSGSVHGVITGHVSRMAHDIALAETFGPNPEKAFQVLMDRARIAGDKDKANFAQNLFHEISGKTTPGEIPTWAEYSQGLRNLLVSTKLGGAALSSITDNATLHIVAQLNNLSSMQTFRNQLAAFNPFTKADRDLARINGMGLDIFTQTLNRWGEEGLGGDMSGKLAAGTLRLSGLQAMTEANKRAYGVTMMGGIGKLVREQDFAALAHSDNRILASKGVTATDFAVWKKAKLEDWGNGNDSMLTPQTIARIPDALLAGIAPDIPPAILRNKAIEKLLGAVLEETDNAVITTGYRERAILRQGTEKGTVAGELARHVTLFKSYPVAMITKHWSRALSMPSVTGKVVYAATLFGTLTIMGAAAMSIKDVIAGKDPRSFKDPRTWLAAMAQGGGLGIYGDYLFSDQSRYGNSLTASLAGPTAGLLEDTYKLTAGNIHQAIRGERTHFGAEAVKFAKGNIPLINLWYTKTALDRFILNDLQEYLSPGYLSRLRETSRKNTGQDYWFAPGSHQPDRAPDMAAFAQ